MELIDNSMPRSGCSALHGVNPNLKKKKFTYQSCKIDSRSIWSENKSKKQNNFVGHMKEEKTLREMYHVVDSKIK